MVNRLEGKVVIVTGAAQGQGAMHVRMLAEEGAQVLMGDVLDDAGQALANDLTSEGMDVTYAHLDVCQPEDWALAVDRAVGAYGKVTSLVNNAGVSSRPGVADVLMDEWLRTISINQTGVMLGMQAVLPEIRRQGSGSIVNISSVWAHTGGFGDGADNGSISYVASKAAVLGMTRSAALELGSQDIRVNSISPGYIDHLMSGPPDPSVQAALERIPLGRLAQLAEISHAVVFFVADESRYITGIDVLIDGGLHLG